MRYFSGYFILFFLSISFISEAREQNEVYIAAVDSDGIQRVDVLAGEYILNPDYIIVKVNVPVELRVKKEPGLVPHDFVIKAPEAGIDILESLGTEQNSIKFIPKRVGKHPFYCDKKLLFFKSHKEKGMEGVLEVIE